MSIKERLDAAEAKLYELNAQMEDAKAAVTESMNESIEGFKADMENAKAGVKEASDEQERKLELKAEERMDSLIAADEKIEAGIEEKREASRAKRKRLQDKINELSQAYAKADQEELIMELIDYAEDCQAGAVYLAQEAVQAYKEAAEQIAIYNKKYK